MASYDPNDPTSEGWSTQRAGEAPTYPPAPGGLPAAASDVRWVAGKDVIAGELVQHDGTLYTVEAPMTLPSVFTTAGLTPVGGGGGGGGGTGSGVADSFKGDWVDGPYVKNDMVTRNKSLYVATKDALAGDDPAFVGAPVDVGGIGSGSVNPSTPGQWTGSEGNTWTRFTCSGTSVTAISLWSAPGQNVPGPVSVGLYTADRVTKLGSGVGPSNWTGFTTITLTDVVPLAAGDYCLWYTLGLHVGVQLTGAQTPPDGVVTAYPVTNPSYTTDYGNGTYVTPFRLWTPPASNSAWVRVLKGV